MPNYFGVIPVPLETITVTFSNLTQPTLHATWCNHITADLLQFEQWAEFRFVAEWAMTSECSHCWLQRSSGWRVEEFRNFWHRKTVTCQTQRVRASQRRSANLLMAQTLRSGAEQLTYLRSTGCWGLRSSHPGDGNACGAISLFEFLYFVRESSFGAR